MADVRQNMPPSEVDMSIDLARALVESQRPDLTGQEITTLGEGWDNWSYRLGDGLVLRFPRRSIAAPLIENEWRWLSRLAPQLPLRIPVPTFLGEPALGYPFRWAIYPYLPGLPASRADPVDLTETARLVALFLSALHQPAPPDAPPNPFRGVPLEERFEPTMERIRSLRAEGFDRADELGAIWNHAVAVPDEHDSAVWVHADFHPDNLLIDGGRLTAVLDWGDLTAGDPAVDLSIAWTMFTEETRPALRAGYHSVPDVLWERARGWALSLGLAMMMTSEDNPLMRRVGARAVRAVLDDRSL